MNVGESNSAASLPDPWGLICGDCFLAFGGSATCAGASVAVTMISLRSGEKIPRTGRVRVVGGGHTVFPSGGFVLLDQLFELGLQILQCGVGRLRAGQRGVGI